MRSEKITFSSQSSTVNDDQKKTNNPFSVLLVDDDPIARTINKWLELSTKNESFAVHQAANGQEDIDFHRAGASFDLILMDLDLPVKNGYEATRELRDLGISTAIVGVASSDEDKLKGFMEVGLDDCISKPLTLNKIAPYIPGLPSYSSEAENNIQGYDCADDGNDDLNSICSSNSDNF